MTTAFGCVLLVDPAGRILLQERDEHAPIDPERWGMCGGHLEPGEDPAAGALRELQEETGIVLPPGVLRPWRTLMVHHKVYGTTDPVHVFVAGVALTDDDVTCHEGRQIRFVDAEAALHLPLTHSAARAVPGLVAGAAYRAAVHEARALSEGPVRVALGAVVDAAGRILLQERDEHAPVDPDRWTFPGGRVEPGEDYVTAVARELREETDLDIAPARWERVAAYRWDDDAAHLAVEAELWAVRLDDADPAVACHEGRRMVFRSVDDARGLPLTRLMAEALPDFLASDCYRRSIA
ncbi:NUDIX domain-containing protein [Nocardioides sp.]|uniref:NUDIX domain-containing protein n=1 Tax=Nocardioides sp. TaxID=35761 RepID=UPI00351485B0